MRKLPKDVLKMASGLISPSGLAGHRGQLCNEAQGEVGLGTEMLKFCHLYAWTQVHACLEFSILENRLTREVRRWPGGAE